MTKSTKLKIFNDPIYGFIGIPSTLIFNIIAHPYFQRLRRISQMGLSYLVYPGAHHTRFHHALGSMHLMTKAIQVLRYKGVDVTTEEEEGLLCAILLHDIGHGPFSHAMEHSIVDGVSHEAISLLFMEQLNEEFSNELAIAIAIFKGEYSKKFLNQLVSSQLDMDRLDYLKRDSFYTGVAEGNINADRLITMLNVVEGELVIEEKGIYSVEKFLMARRFMYWQVYLHKTGLVAEQLLIKTLHRAKALQVMGKEVPCSSVLGYFMTHKITINDFNAAVLEQFSQLDDVDIMSAIKSWQNHPDFVLSKLSKMILNRELLDIKMKKKEIASEKIESEFLKFKKKHELSDDETAYFVFSGIIKNRAYSQLNQPIKILRENGKIVDVSKASDQLNGKSLSKTVVKYYVCYPKSI